MSQRKSPVRPATAKLSDNVKSLTDAAKSGQAFGAVLGAAAAQILLSEFGVRNQPTSPASDRWGRAWDGLEAALGVMVDDPKVAAALASVDSAHGEALAEIEDRTWHAAWGAVVGIFRGGAR